MIENSNILFIAPTYSVTPAPASCPRDLIGI